MSAYHIPVMLKETIDYLQIQRGKWYVDCNLGGGGHTEEILRRGGKVIGIDLDMDAISEVAKNHDLQIKLIDNHLQAISDDLILYQTNFKNIKEAVSLVNQPVSGVLFDLGVSSYQLETPDRGFSFNAEAPLDMRMDTASGATASDLINGLYEKELAELFWKYGEEIFSRPIAKKIVEYRKNKKIETTDELANIVLSVRRRDSKDRTHPATRIFQALRIAVNDELYSLEEALPKALDVLSAKGKMVVISFHSLEDRIVKNFFKNQQDQGKVKIITKKPIEPTEEEIELNPRARSGKLRVAEKLTNSSSPSL